MSVSRSAVPSPFDSNPLGSVDHASSCDDARAGAGDQQTAVSAESVEEWRPIDGWRGFYEVSSHGRVRSVDHVIVDSRGNTRRVCGRVLKLAVPSDPTQGGCAPRCSLSAQGDKRTYYPSRQAPLGEGSDGHA
jgi:NUMOD4 motif